MTEIQFSNKTKKDVALAQRINKLIAALERLQVRAGASRGLADAAA
jgi:hypothetical protein